jgi:predicted RNA binding protein YcfA (HicA-like mRNA interferase family)
MSQWKAAKARLVLSALLHIGWAIKRKEKGSHRLLSKKGWADFVFSFHNNEEIGPRMLSRIAKKTGLIPEDL